MTRDRVLLAWSSGKDSAFALHVLRQREEVEVVRIPHQCSNAAYEAAMERALHDAKPRGIVAAVFAGREFDARLLADLPTGVDPCGENGEFHTFAWDGPMFDCPVPVRVGEIVSREGFVFADLLPAAGGGAPGLAIQAAT